MRLGGPVFEKCETVDQWAGAVRSLGYRAAYCPVSLDASTEVIRAYASAAKNADIVIAEVGAWSNPLSSDGEKRTAALDRCKKSLALADELGARCCVNISGSRGAKWDGPSELDLTDETFTMIVETIRGIIDAVGPKRTFYTLETMPWMYPDSAQSYLDLLKAIDRKAFAVHFDPVNLVCSPQRYFDNTHLIQEFIAKLGPYIKSCHAKDILLGERLTVHLDEICPGRGKLDYRTYLLEISKLPDDVTIMLEHLPTPEDYTEAANYIRGIARQEGLTL